MFRIVVLLFVLIAQPAFACDPKAGSTFCAEGVMTQPVAIQRGDDDDAHTDDNGIYVEGAVTIDTDDDAQL